MEPTPTILFKNHTGEELAVLLAPFGVNAKLAGKLQSTVLRNALDEVPKVMEQTSWRVLKKVENATRIPTLQLIDKQVSPAMGLPSTFSKAKGMNLLKPFAYLFAC